LVEIHITYRYLLTKNTDEIWAEYRSFGMSQAKLSFLKALRTENLPHFIELDTIGDYVNEGTWLEFQNIELGAWHGSNLRKLAEETGLKELYDSHYDVLSSFSHGHWLALRDSTFEICRNPLHRYHRIPAPMLPRRSTLPDAVRLANFILSDLNQLYPGLDTQLSLTSTKPSKANDAKPARPARRRPPKAAKKKR
jgi:hypothetical protein